MVPVLCLNGPNLDLLGVRQPEVYGTITLAELETSVVDWGRRLGLGVECWQTNDEAEMIDALHGARHHGGVVLNPGALTHTSAALGDAVASLEIPVVEVHLSNVRGRERWRRRSYVSPGAAHTIFGRGAEGYRAALRHLVNRPAHPFQTLGYGPHPDQVFDLRRGDSSLGVLLLHGGFWGDAWGRDMTESWAVDLARKGVSTANLEYRRVGSGGGVVPTLSDVRRGTRRAVEALATRQVMAVGHSAGAHLLLAAGSRSPSPLAAVVSIGGVLDLEEADREGRGEGAVARFDPALTTSLFSLPPPPAPVLLVHGESDRVVPADHSRRYAGHLDRLGAPHRLSVLERVGHFDALDPSSTAWEEACKEMQEAATAGGPLL